MNLKKILVPLGAVALMGAGYRGFGWSGVALVGGGMVMWGLMHYTRLMHVLEKARNSPMGYVGSAVMLNAKLKPGQPLLHVIAMTRSLGTLQSAQGAQPEVYRWTDGSDSHVTAEFVDGRLAQWSLYRPPADDAPADPPAP